MIDIHCHLLFGVDDGPKEISESMRMLDVAKKQGINSIILTPHYRHGLFPYKRSFIEEKMSQIEDYAFELGINLFLGCEYHVNSKMLENFDSGRCMTMAGSNYILAEYKEDSDYHSIKDSIINAICSGYIPIIAHVERYACLVAKPKLIDELRKIGAMVQINADALLGIDGRKAKKFTISLLKHGWVDFVASDSHDTTSRPCRLREAYNYVQKKFGENIAEKLFVENAVQIITSMDMPTIDVKFEDDLKELSDSLALNFSFDDATLDKVREEEKAELDRQIQDPFGGDLPLFMLMNEPVGKTGIEMARLPHEIKLD